MEAAEERVLVDTNVLIYATLENDPRFEIARDLLLSSRSGQRYVSGQNLAEMYPNLTGPKMETPMSPPLLGPKSSRSRPRQRSRSCRCPQERGPREDTATAQLHAPLTCRFALENGLQ
jgi:hypothetical protein